MDIQRCYHENKTWGMQGSLSDVVSSWQAQAAEGLRVTWERWAWWLDDMSSGWGGPASGGGPVGGSSAASDSGGGGEQQGSTRPSG